MKSKIVLILLLIIFSGTTFGIVNDYRAILDSYDKNNPASSISVLVDFLKDNPSNRPAYLALLGWCRAADDYSSLSNFSLTGTPSEAFLYCVHMFYNGNKEESLKLMTDIIIENENELDEGFGFHFCDFAEAARDEKTAQQIINRLTGAEGNSAIRSAALARLFYDKGGLKDAAEALEEGIAVFPKSFFLHALYAYYYQDLSQFFHRFSLNDNRKALTGLTTDDPYRLAIINFLDGQYSYTQSKQAEALKSLADSEALFDKYGFITFKAELFLLKANFLRTRQDYKAALQTLNAIKPMLVKIDVPGYSFTLNLTLGDIYAIAGRYEEASAFFAEAKKNVIHNSHMMFLRQSLSSLYLTIRKFDESLKEARAGLALAEETDNNIFKIAFYTQLANILNELGSFEEALAFTDKAVETVNKEDKQSYLIPILASKANTLQFIGRYSDSRKIFLEALKISEKYSTPISSAKIIASLGILSIRTFDLDNAKKYLNRAAAVFRKNNDKYNLAITIGNLGEAYLKGNEFYKALKSYQDAIKLTQELRDIRSTALFYSGMGSVYQKIGDNKKALEIYKNAEKIYVELDSKHYLGEYYTNLAGIYYDMDDYKNSELYDQKAIGLFKELGESWSLFNVYSNLFVTAWAKNDIRKMTSSLKSMKELSVSMNDPYVNDETGLMEGALLNKKGKSIDARKKLTPIISTIKNYNQRAAWINFEMGISYKNESNYKAALQYFDEALKYIEKERQALRMGGEIKGFFKKNRIYYDEYIDALYKYLVQSGDKSLINNLFSTIEQFKERNFSDSLVESRASLERFISKELKDRETNILGKISFFNTNVNYAETDEQLHAALEGRDKAEKELEDLKIEIRSKNPGYAGLVYPTPAGVNEAKKALKADDTVLISYFIQDNYLYIFSLTRNDVQVVRTEEAKKINSDVKMLLSFLNTPDPSNAGKIKKTAASLYQKLLMPVQNIGGLNKNIIIVPDEILYYLPFEVLVQPNGKYVVEEHTVSYAPSATALLLLNLSRQNSKKELFAVANPSVSRLENTDITETGLITAERGFDIDTIKSPLPYSEDEIKNISSLFADKGCKTFTGKEASEEAVKSEDLTDYRFLHFATHGIFNEHNPYNSALLFSIDDDPAEDGLLQYREIFDLKTNAELVVLSACKTGLGGIVKGEGLIGISRGFLVSGSESVVVSLWNVSDLSTAFFMNEFYKNIIIRKLPKSEALRQAKITLIRMQTGASSSSERGVSGITKGRQKVTPTGFSHPYFWGAFILIGNNN